MLDIPGQYEPILPNPLRTGSPRVVVLGLGYVGLPLALEAAAAGCDVLGLDPAPSARARASAAWRARSTTASHGGRFAEAAHPRGPADAWLICVPTPLDMQGKPDLGAVEAALGTCAANLSPGALVCLVSTCQPGATRTLCRPALERTGLQVGRDVFLAVSPERENPGAPTLDQRSIPRLLGALDPVSLEHALAFWRRLTDRVVPVSAAEVAECAKLLENTYRLVNIALMGELHEAFTALGVPTGEVVAAAATKPFGFAPFWPGLGAGGHCIPVDPSYLQMEAAQAGAPSSVLEAATAANLSRAGSVARRIAAWFGGSVEGRRILVAGICYKPEVPDLRNSASIRLIHLLRDAGAEVAWTDPLIADEVPELGDVPRAPCPTAFAPEAVVLGAPHRALSTGRALSDLAPVVFDPFGCLPRRPGDGVVVV